MKGKFTIKLAGKQRKIKLSKISIKKTRIKTLRTTNLNTEAAAPISSPLSVGSKNSSDFALSTTGSRRGSLYSNPGYLTLADLKSAFSSKGQNLLISVGQNNAKLRSHSLPNLKKTSSKSLSIHKHQDERRPNSSAFDLQTAQPLPEIKHRIFGPPSTPRRPNRHQKLSLFEVNNKIHDSASEVQAAGGIGMAAINHQNLANVSQISKVDGRLFREHIQWINAQIQKYTLERKSDSEGDFGRNVKANQENQVTHVPIFQKSSMDNGDTLIVSLLKNNQQQTRSNPEDDPEVKHFVEVLLRIRRQLEESAANLKEYSKALKVSAEKLEVANHDLDNERTRSSSLDKQLIESSIQLQKSVDFANQLKSKYDVKFTELMTANTEIELLKSKVHEMVKRYSPTDELKLKETLQQNTTLVKEVSELQAVVQNQNIQITQFQKETPKLHEDYLSEIHRTKAMHEDEAGSLNDEISRLKNELSDAQVDAAVQKNASTQTNKSSFWSFLSCR